MDGPIEMMVFISSGKVMAKPSLSTVGRVLVASVGKSGVGGSGIGVGGSAGAGAVSAGGLGGGVVAGVAPLLHAASSSTNANPKKTLMIFFIF